MNFTNDPISVLISLLVLARRDRPARQTPEWGSEKGLNPVAASPAQPVLERPHQQRIRLGPSRGDRAAITVCESNRSEPRPPRLFGTGCCMRRLSCAYEGAGGLTNARGTPQDFADF
jgi:hypothetical protein